MAHTIKVEMLKDQLENYGKTDVELQVNNKLFEEYLKNNAG